jgi:hypothetical protein
MNVAPAARQTRLDRSNAAEVESPRFPSRCGLALISVARLGGGPSREGADRSNTRGGDASRDLDAVGGEMRPEPTGVQPAFETLNQDCPSWKQI